MKAPMILPWLARKWDVSDERALQLWDQACRDAGAAYGDQVSSRSLGYAKSRMLDLLDHEVIARYPVTDTPWVMIRLNLLRFVAAFRCLVGTLEQRYMATPHS